MKRPRTLAGRLFLWQLSVVVAVLLGVGLVIDVVLERDSVGDLTRSLAAQAHTVAEALPSDPSALQNAVAALGEAGRIRITVIRTDGVVLADSEHDPATMENHLGRPEVQRALAGNLGTASRESATLGVSFRYVALPPEDGVLVRVAVPLTRVEQRTRTVRIAIAIGLLAAAGATALGALLVSRGVSRPLRRATASLARLGEGDLSARVTPAGGPEEFAVLSATLNEMARRLEDGIRTSAEERRTQDLILSSMREGILLGGPDGRVRFSNPAMEGFLGARPDTVSSLTPLGLREAALRAARDRAPAKVDVETAAPARSLRGVALPAGDDGSVLLVLQDVTEAKRLDAIRRDFVANASHELKTPAASIRAAAETIRHAAAEDPAAIQRFAEQLDREAVRLSRIVSDLLDLSRLETGSDLAELVALDGLVREEAARFEELAADAAVTLSVRAEPAPEVRGSARDLSLLVRNLLDNAIRYTKPGGRVDVGLRPANGAVALIVEDTGLGIPSRDLPRIFERFYRVDRARSRETGGTGLGLSIVKHVVENHGGTVTVSSELGRGTTFEVRLPAAT